MFKVPGREVTPDACAECHNDAVIGREPRAGGANVVGMPRVHADAMDVGYLDETAVALDLRSLLDDSRLEAVEPPLAES